MNQIQRISKRFRILFSIGFWIIPLFIIGFWLTGGYSMLPPVDVFMPAEYLQLVPLMPRWALFLGCILTFVPAGFVMLAIYWLIKLFKLYEQNKIFTGDNVRYIRNIGYAVLAGEIVSFCFHPGMTALVSATSHVVRPLFEIKFGIGDITRLLVAFVVILIAWIMRAGQKLQEESDYTV